METCKVEFTSTSGQKIVIDFTLSDSDDLDFRPRFEPRVDPKTDLGLAGMLCEIFLTALIKDQETPQPQKKKSLVS